jgi:hypothetical protein
LRLGVRDPDPRRVEEFSRLLPSLILSGPPGVTATGGRPQVSEVVAYWPCLVPRDVVRATVETLRADGTRRSAAFDWPALAAEREPYAPVGALAARPMEPGGASVEVALSALAHGRSGDKGDTANVGILACSPEAYAWIARHLTAERVKAFFGPMCKGPVERFEVPNLMALNFLLHHALGGGGTLSLHIDAQGKTLAHALLKMPLSVPAALPATVPEEVP